MESMGKSNLSKVSELTSNDGIQAVSPYAGLKLVDLGVKLPGGWSAGKKLIENTIGGLGDVSFGETNIHGFSLATVDIYYDNPVESGIAESVSISGRKFKVYREQKLIYLETDELPDAGELKDLPAATGTADKELVLAAASPVSLVAAIYACSQAAPLFLKQLLQKGLAEEEIIWAWSTVPLPTLADDGRLMEARTEAALKYGSVLSFWVRSEDEKIEEALKEIVPYGEVRIHNLRTARTIIRGFADHDKLKESFGI